MYTNYDISNVSQVKSPINLIKAAFGRAWRYNCYTKSLAGWLILIIRHRYIRQVLQKRACKLCSKSRIINLSISSLL